METENSEIFRGPDSLRVLSFGPMPPTRPLPSGWSGRWRILKFFVGLTPCGSPLLGPGSLPPLPRVVQANAEF